MDTLLDFLGSLLDWDPIWFIGRRWVKRYEAGRRVFTRGTVSGLTGSPRWAIWLVANDHWLFVADQKGEITPLYPLPDPSPDSTVEECIGTLKGKSFHYRYKGSSGFIEVYPAAPAAGYLVKRALDEMHVARARPC